MRACIVSSTGRAATRVCAACRNEAKTKLSREPFSIARQSGSATAQPRTKAPIATSRSPTATTARWLSQSHNPLRAASSPTASASKDPSSTSSSISTPIYYALFPETLPLGPPPAGPFVIDVRALRREFLRLQATAHPDFHHHAASTSPDQTAARRHAEGASALINSAFKTLTSPLLRAQYLLREQHGVDLEGDERGAQAEADPELLMTVLEAREAIEEAEREEDLGELRRVNEERIAEAEEALGRAFRDGDVEAAKAEAVRLRYWMNIRESVDNWERGKPVVLQH